MAITRVRHCTADDTRRRESLEASLRRFLDDASTSPLPAPPVGGLELPRK